MRGRVFAAWQSPNPAAAAREAAAVSVVYAIGVEVLIFRAFGWREVFDIAKDSAISTGVIFILLAMGSVLSFFITLAQVPAFFTQMFADWKVNWITFLLIVNVIFFIAGMFIDPNSILLVLVPTFYPVSVALGIDPVHFGVVMTVNLSIGMFTPPFGLNIFIIQAMFKVPLPTLYRGLVPVIGVNLVALFIISAWPDLTLWLVRLLK